MFARRALRNTCLRSTRAKRPALKSGACSRHRPRSASRSGPPPARASSHLSRWGRASRRGGGRALTRATGGGGGGGQILLSLRSLARRLSAPPRNQRARITAPAPPTRRRGPSNGPECERGRGRPPGAAPAPESSPSRMRHAASRAAPFQNFLERPRQPGSARHFRGPAPRVSPHRRPPKFTM